MYENNEKTAFHFGNGSDDWRLAEDSKCAISQTSRNTTDGSMLTSNVPLDNQLSTFSIHTLNQPWSASLASAARSSDRLIQ